MTDLLSLVVTVRADEDVVLPGHLGHAVYLLVLGWIAADDPALAQRLQQEEGQKPFTCSTLVGLKRLPHGHGLAAGSTAWFRLTALTAEVAGVLLRCEAQPPETITLEDQLLHVVQITSQTQQHPWANATDYQTLASPYLLAEQIPNRSLRLHFSSPTTFRQGERNLPLPICDLVIGGLADKWNLFSPIALSPEIREYARLALTLNHFKVQSGLVRLKDEAFRTGFVGYAEYRAQHYDRYWLSLSTLLAEYAFYAGVGRATTQGLGQAQRVTSYDDVSERSSHARRRV